MIAGGLARWIPVVVLSLLAVPAAVVAATALTRWRRAYGHEPGVARWRSWAEVGMIAGTVPWVWMILTPLDNPRELWLVPFSDLASLVHDGPPEYVVVQVVGNLLVFAALGFLAPLRWAIGPLAVLAIAAAGSATVEALQYLLDIGRVTSVDDVLLNAGGAALAAMVSRAVLPSVVSRAGTRPARAARRGVPSVP
jgi:hypothetical protein